MAPEKSGKALWYASYNLHLEYKSAPVVLQTSKYSMKLIKLEFWEPHLDGSIPKLYNEFLILHSL